MPALEMNTADAAARGLTDGITVKVFNDLGEVYLQLRITDGRSAWSDEFGERRVASDEPERTDGIGLGSHATKADLAEGRLPTNDCRVEVAAH